MDVFAPYQKICTYFIVKNVTPDRKKTISVFQYPINFGKDRDLMRIPGISDQSIRSSLLKGELRHKFLAKDIELVYSNINLLVFDDCQHDFLTSIGVDIGAHVTCAQLDPSVYECIDGYITANHPNIDGYGGGGSINYAWKEKIALIGLRNGINKTFYTPDKFINGSYFGNTFHITIEHNGKELYENIDFSIAESGGPGTGYDTIHIFSLTPNSHSLLFATYTIKI